MLHHFTHFKSLWSFLARLVACLVIVTACIFANTGFASASEVDRQMFAQQTLAPQVQQVQPASQQSDTDQHYLNPLAAKMHGDDPEFLYAFTRFDTSAEVLGVALLTYQANTGVNEGQKARQSIDSFVQANGCRLAPGKHSTSHTELMIYCKYGDTYKVSVYSDPHIISRLTGDPLYMHPEVFIVSRIAGLKHPIR